MHPIRRSGDTGLWYTGAVDVRTWTAISRLLDEALDLPPEARQAWLESLPPEHETLKPRLQAMLDQASTTTVEAFLATLPKLRDEALAEPDDGLSLRAGREGRMVGPYRLVREIASGGQGSVWLADRPDGLVNRPVAIKLPIGLAFRPDLAERVARERDILAGLSHPHIARLYDAGVTATGEPYLALEYVEGTPIDRYCDDRHLDVAERVRVFLQVVRAVAYAHGQLVIHRDLKPSNVLVTTDGYVRLLDFGIARLLDRSPDRDSTLTEAGGRAMTLSYASPEQVSRAPLGVATDVYSLGVMLYELLAGRTPYRPARDTVAALEEAILAGDICRPSEAAPDGGRRRAIAGDLDTVVLKALKRAPADRYATADALADDLERYLDGRPVRAQPDSRWYRTRKFVARHRLPVAAAAAVVTAIVIGAGVAVWQAQVARAEQARAEAVKAFIASILQDANLDAQAAREQTVLGLLTQAGDRVDALPAGPVKAELLLVLGEGLLSLGDTDTLESVARRAVAEATAPGADESLEYRARVLMAYTHLYRGRPDEMRAELEAIAPRLERAPGFYADELSTVWRLKADAALDAGSYDAAEAAALNSLKYAEAGSGPQSSRALTALGILVDVYRFQGKRQEAVEAAARAAGLARRIFGENGRHPSSIRARAQYARALGDTGQFARAVDELQSTLEIAEQVFGQDGRTVAFHLQSLANFQLRLGRLNDAMSSVTRGLTIIERHTEPGSTTLGAFHSVAGNASLFARRAGPAIEHLSQALAIGLNVLGPANVNTLGTRGSLGLALQLAGRPDEAWQEIERGLADMKAAGKPVARLLYAAATLSRVRGETDRAETLLDEADGAAGGDPLLKAQILTEQGLVSLDNGDVPVALTRLQAAAVRFDELGIEPTPARADVLIGLGRAWMAGREPARAEPFFDDASRFWASFDGNHPEAAIAASWLARCRAALGSTR
jgi:serine/threonine-protein kinase